MKASKLIKAMLITGIFASIYHLQAGEKYQIDPMHSKVGFEVPHLVISSVEGKFTEFNGTIDLDEKNLGKSKVIAELNVKSIDTGVKKRDNHLLSKDFFEVAKYPNMKFVSHKITGNKSKFKMAGTLTLKGKTKTVIFEGKYLGTVKDGYGNIKAAFEATTKINRKDFGLSWNSMVEAGPVVGDDVSITLKIQATKVTEKKQANNDVSPNRFLHPDKLINGVAQLSTRPSPLNRAQ